MRLHSKITACAVGAWMALVLVLIIRTVQGAIPSRGLSAIAAAAFVLAIAEAIRTVASAWRGPPVVEFPRASAVLCEPADAEAIRASAQLRGTMGGAGHVYPARLGFQAVAWVSAAGVAAATWIAPWSAAGLLWSLGVLASTVGVAVCFPARPFYYREAMGGWLAVSDGSVQALLVARHRSRLERLRRSGSGGAPAGGSRRPAST